MAEPIETLSVLAQLSEAFVKFLTTFEDMTKALTERLQNSEIRAIQDVEANNLPSAPATIFNVPNPQNPDFVGRSDALNQLFGMWKPGEKARIGICGLGGIGKTELVLEFAYRLHQISPATPINWFTKENSLHDATTDKIDSLEVWLKESYPMETVLVIDPGHEFQLLQQPIPGYGTLMEKLKLFNGTIILLSRSIQDANELVGPRDIMELEDLDLEASSILLRTNLGPHTSPVPEADLFDLVRLMTCLPRAIKQAIDVINKTGMTVSQFLDMYQESDEQKIRLLGRIKPVSNPDEISSILGLGIFGVQRFRHHFTEPSRMLYQIYFLGGALVPRSIFSNLDTLNMIIISRILKGHFLVIEDSSNGSLTLHPLVHLVIHKLTTSERPQSDEDDVLQEQKWYEETMVTFAKQYPDANVEDRAWWKGCFSQLLNGRDTSSEAVRLSVAAIYRKESNYLKRKGLFTQALRMISLAKGVLPDPLSHDCLSIIHDQVALFDILAKYRDMQANLQSYPGDYQAGLLWKKRMGARLEDAECANKYNSAIELFTQIQTAKESSNSPKVDVLQAVDDYAWALMLKGKYEDAVVECRKALVGRTAELGGSHVDTLSSYHNLSEMLRRAGKYDEALRHIQESIRGRETVLGVDHPDTIQSRTVKAKIMLAKAVSQTDFDEVETILVNSTNKLASSLTDTHPIVMNCKSDRALIMLARGKYEAAEGMLLSIIADKTNGPWLEPATHPDTLTSKHQLAEVMRLKEGCKVADILSERSLTERTGVLTDGTLSGTDFHPDQLTSLHHRSIVLSGLGQHLPALQKIDLALTGRKAILGLDHPDVLWSMTWKGEIMRTQLPSYQSQRTQTVAAIEALHKTAHEGLTSLFGPEHHLSLQTLTHLALAINERGPSGVSIAQDLYRQVYRSYIRTVGAGHIETLKSKCRLADALGIGGSDKGEAKRLWREACAGFASGYGVDAYVTKAAYKGYEKFLKGNSET